MFVKTCFMLYFTAGFCDFDQGFSSNKVNKLQELLDVKQNQRSGTQLVAEIRKQANDVL